MKKYIFVFIFFLFIFFCFFIFIKINDKSDFPINISNKNICANDGMTIIEYKGPKAQIIWKDGSISFYCEVREAFFEWTNFIKRKRIKKFYVQDFSFIKWGSYTNNWVEACKVVYVIDSIKYGAMGISYVPFTDIIYANLFVDKYQGIIINFDDIIIDVLDKSNEFFKDRILKSCS